MDFGALFLGLIGLGGLCFVFGVIYPAIMVVVWFFKYRKVQSLKKFMKEI